MYFAAAFTLVFDIYYNSMKHICSILIPVMIVVLQS